MAPDDDPPIADTTTNFNPVESDDALTAHEQAQLDAMRTGGEVPDDPPTPEPAPAPAALDAPATPAAGTPAPAPAAGDKTTPADPLDPDRDVDVLLPEGGKPQKRVSIHKFQRMETRASEAERKLTEIQEQLAREKEDKTRIDERLKIINEALGTPGAPLPGQPGAQQQEEMPDPEKDIFGAFNWLVKFSKEQGQKIEQLVTGTQEQAQENEIFEAYQGDAARFSQTPEGAAFAEAYVYLINQRDQELLEAGITDETKRKQQIVREEKGLVRQAIENKQSPAQRIFKLAQTRGYRPTPAKVPGALDSPAPAAKPTNGAAGAAVPAPARPAAPAAAVPARAVPSVTEEVARIAAAQAAGQSLSSVGGGAPQLELTPQMLADMSEEEFADMMARLPKGKVRELLGE